MKLDFKQNVDLSFGAGGRAMHQLVEQLMLAEFDNEYLASQGDQAILPQVSGKLAFSCDSYVISPLFFNGGDIGSLAVNGTINDLSVGGAQPLYLSVSLIIEEGFALSALQQIIRSMAKAAREAGVLVVTGDTKVVERGKGDGLFINTSGIGVISAAVTMLPEFKVGDKIILNGAMANHGMAIMAQRQGIDFASDIQSDCAALNDLIATVLKLAPELRAMRDPTRGGVAASLNEWAASYGLEIRLVEEQLVVQPSVAALCELLGIEALNVANEGKVLIACAPEHANRILAELHQHPLGRDASIIGEVMDLNTAGCVSMLTRFGGVRRVEWLNSEQLPRIC